MKKNISLITFHLSEKNINFKDKVNCKNNFLIGNWCRADKERFNKNINLSSRTIYDKKLPLSKKKILDRKSIFFLNLKPNELKFISLKYKNLQNLLHENLNLIHGKNYKRKYWDFLLRRWLLIYINTSYSYWKVAGECLKKYNIKSFYSLNLDGKAFIPETTFHFRMISLMHSGYWSHWTFEKIFRFRSKKLQSQKISLKRKLNIKENFFKYAKIFKSTALNISLSKKIFFNSLSFDKKIYFDFFKKNKFLNFHYNLREINLKNIKNNEVIRTLFFKNLGKTQCKFESFLIEHMHNCLPKIYLENYNLLESQYKTLNWPSNPDFILATYYEYDEIFKIYCANKIIQRSKFFLFQHGGDEGIYDDNKKFKFLNITNHICDKFFSWGKNTEHKKKEFFYIKKQFNKTKNFVSPENKKILFLPLFFQETIRDDAAAGTFRFNFALINQIIFRNINTLYKATNNHTIYNSHARPMDMTENQNFIKLIKLKNKKLKFLDTRNNFLDEIQKYNLIIHFYLATPFFESMLSNRPSIVIFEKKMHFKFNKKFNLIIKKLFKQKIFFSSAKKSSDFINSNYKNLENWWNSKAVQDLRVEVCENYCNNYNAESIVVKKMFD